MQALVTYVVKRPVKVIQPAKISSKIPIALLQATKPVWTQTPKFLLLI
jgi:hypothetical protein